MDRDQTPRRVPAIRRVIGHGLLLLFLVGATPAAPALTPPAARADGGRRVVVQETARGIRVVLGHDCAHAPGHRHGPIARTLTLVAERPAGSMRDHILQFNAAPATERNRAAVREAAPDSSIQLLLTPDGASASWTRPSLRLAGCPAASLAGGGPLPKYRSTVRIL